MGTFLEYRKDFSNKLFWIARNPITLREGIGETEQEAIEDLNDVEECLGNWE
jgi:hypothetical protein